MIEVNVRISPGIGSAPGHGFGHRRVPGVNLNLNADPPPQADRQAAPQAAPKTVASGLETLLCDATPLDPPARRLAAARAFSLGSFLLPGQIIDRAI